MTVLTDNIALAQVLSELKNYQRQIILQYLDDKGCNVIKSYADLILHKGHKSPAQKKIKRLIETNKNDLYDVMMTTSKKKSKSKIAKIGGNPLALILSTAIPLVVELLKKKQK